MKKRFNLNQLEYLLESSDRNLDLEGSDVTVNSLTSDTGITITAQGVYIAAGDLTVTNVTAGTPYLERGDGIIFYQGAAASSPNDTSAVTAAKVLTGIVTCTPTTARSKATDTAANFVSGLSLGANGDSFDFSFMNLATTDGYNVTLTAGTGITLVGNPIIAARDDADNAVSVGVGEFRVRRTGATAVTIYRMS